MKIVKMLIVVMCLFFPMQVKAANVEVADVKATDVEEELSSRYDFTEIDKMLEEIFPEEKLNFKDTIVGLISGELDFSFDLIKNLINEIQIT